MHCGKLTGNNAAMRVYRVLTERWIAVDELAARSETVSTSTRVSEVRRQLPDGQRIEHTAKNPWGMEPKRGSWYRLIGAEQ